MSSSKGPAKRKVADYVESVLLEKLPLVEMKHRPFNNGIAKAPPLFRKQDVNRIILFPGAFNPPHIGHLNLLRWVFEHAGHDLHIVAAIVVMTDDDRLVYKTSGEPDPLILKREERLKLWVGEGLPVDWLWVFERSEASWAAFRTEFEAAVKKDKIDVRFLMLGGPDWISSARMISPEY